MPGISGYAVVSTSKYLSLVSHRVDTETCHEPFCTLSKVPLNDIKVLMAEIVKYTEL
jgi:predicted transglutaminase-like protease